MSSGFSPTILPTPSVPKWLEKDVQLGPYTTISLGGRADFFGRAQNHSDILDMLNFAALNGQPFYVLGGGSNLVFDDQGFRGLVIKCEINKPLQISHKTKDHIYVWVGAGCLWDDFVDECVTQGWSGVECLSGIPGTVGAAPIQNIGAYGQEVSQVIASVEAIDTLFPQRQDCIKDGLGLKNFSPTESQFRYRNSFFKENPHYVVTRVQFRLNLRHINPIAYEALQDEVKTRFHQETALSIEDMKRALGKIRQCVRNLRQRKSMLAGQEGLNARSVGSCFENVYLDDLGLCQFLKKIEKQPTLEKPPIFSENGKHKIPTAWLIENAGFHKGWTPSDEAGMGLSSDHCLAIINRKNPKSDSQAFFDLACLIKEKVLERFGLTINAEPRILDPYGNLKELKTGIK